MQQALSSGGRHLEEGRGGAPTKLQPHLSAVVLHHLRGWKLPSGVEHPRDTAGKETAAHTWTHLRPTPFADCRGQSIVKQHQAVAAVLKEDIAKWHGMRLTTKAAP